MLVYKMNQLLLLAGLVLVIYVMNEKKMFTGISKTLSSGKNNTMLVLVFCGVILFMCMQKGSVVEGAATDGPENTVAATDRLNNSEDINATDGAENTVAATNDTEVTGGLEQPNEWILNCEKNCEQMCGNILNVAKNNIDAAGKVLNNQ